MTTYSIKLGESRTVRLDLPSVSKSVAKVASPLSPEKTEPWIQTCFLVVVDIVTTESITITIELGGSSFEFTIEFTYTKKSVKTSCERTWLEHGQGAI